jgi:hypothetical protein
MAKRRGGHKKARKKGSSGVFNKDYTEILVVAAVTGAGSIIGSFIMKYLLKEVDKTLPVNDSFHAAAKSI